MFELSRELLIDGYINQKKSMLKLANEFGCSYWKVRTLLHKWGIKVRTSNEGRAIKTKKIEWVVDDQGCWICISHSRLKKGYHYIARDGKVYTMHRYLYMKHHGISEDAMRGLVVMHTCDNPSCINIDHLQLGTQHDNMMDMLSKGRDRWSKEKEKGSLVCSTL